MPWFVAVSDLPYHATGNYGPVNGQTMLEARIPTMSVEAWMMRYANGQPSPLGYVVILPLESYRYCEKTRTIYVPVTVITQDPVFAGRADWHPTSGLGDNQLAWVSVRSNYLNSGGQFSSTTVEAYVDKRFLREASDTELPKMTTDTKLVNPISVLWQLGKVTPPAQLSQLSTWYTDVSMGACPFAMEFYLEETKASGRCFWKVSTPPAGSLTMTRTWGKVGSQRKPANTTKRNTRQLGHTLYTMLRDKLVRKHYEPCPEPGKSYTQVLAEELGVKHANPQMMRLLSTIPTGRSLVRVTE